MTLTEQWKKGEIKQGEYWCKTTESPYIERVYLPCCDDIIVEVLAPVPTYQEYLDSEAHCAIYSEENKQLRQLLKECRDFLDNLYFPVVYNDYETNITNNFMRELSNRINVAIGESEE